MKEVFVLNRSRTIATAPRVRYCDTFISQLRGLMFRPRLSRDDGLILVGRRDSRLDSSIHMLFVRFNLAVIWINDEFNVVDKVLAKPWRLAYFPKHPARYVLEIHPERWEDFHIDDKVYFDHA